VKGDRNGSTWTLEDPTRQEKEKKRGPTNPIIGLGGERQRGEKGLAGRVGIRPGKALTTEKRKNNDQRDAAGNSRDIHSRETSDFGKTVRGGGSVTV